MGGSTYTPDDWADLASRSTAASAPTSSAAHTYTARTINDALDPKKIVVRESRHSAVNPASTPVILGCDVTGSMGSILHSLISTVCPVMITEIFARKPVSDPHVMFMAYGDAPNYSDQYPLQVTQFEADIKMLDQLQQFYLEQGGGGNNFESTNLCWHFAAYKTSCDAIELDSRKGFLFTFGDDGPAPDLTAADLVKVYGNDDQILATNAEILQRLESMYHVFHITLTRGHQRFYDGIIKRWNDVLGERHLVLEDATKMGEVIVSTMQLIAGLDLPTVAASWGGGTGLVVAETLKGVGGGVVATATAPGTVVRL